MLGKYLYRVFLVFIGIVSLTLLVSCSSSDSGSDGSGASSSTISGVAASGKAIVGVVYVRGANGNMVSAPTNATGAYVAAVENLAAPFLLRVVPNNGGEALYSYGTAAGQTVNVTPLTNLAVFMASGNKDLRAVFSAWQGKSVLEAEVVRAQKIINANLRDRFAAAGLNANDYNFITATFTADGSGIDGVLDDVVVAVNSKGGNFTVAILPQPGFAFDVSISVAGINVSFSGGGGTGYAGTLSIASLDPDLPDEFSPAFGLDVTNAGVEELVWAIALDTASKVSLQVGVMYPDSSSPTVSVRFADLTVPSNPVYKIWQDVFPGATLVVNRAEKTVTFTNTVVRGGYPLATLNGELSYE